MFLLSDEELLKRWAEVVKEYNKKAAILVPLLQKVSNLEQELFLLSEEIKKRGIKSDKENG